MSLSQVVAYWNSLPELRKSVHKSNMSRSTYHRVVASIGRWIPLMGSVYTRELDWIAD